MIELDPLADDVDSCTDACSVDDAERPALQAVPCPDSEKDSLSETQHVTDSGCVQVKETFNEILVKCDWFVTQICVFGVESKGLGPDYAAGEDVLIDKVCYLLVYSVFCA